MIEDYGCDSAENIQVCLNCTKKYCTNCLSTPPTGKEKIHHNLPGAHYDDVKYELAECFRAGMTLKEIAGLYDVHPNSVGRWKNKLKAEGLL